MTLRGVWEVASTGIVALAAVVLLGLYMHDRGRPPVTPGPGLSRSRDCLVLLFLPLVLACRDEPSGRAEVIEQWSLVDLSLDPIGLAEGPETHTLFRARDALSLGPSLIAVANAREEILLFRRTGEFLRRIGGRGDGPAEFQSLFRLFRLPNDTLMAIDGQRQRVLLFDTVGNYLSAFRLPPEEGREGTAGYAVLGPGKIMAIGHSMAEAPAPTGQIVFRPKVPLYLIEAGKGSTVVGEVLGEPRVIKGTGWRLQPLGPSTLLSTWREGAAVTYGIDSEIRFFDSKGSPAGAFRTPRSPIPVTDEVVSAWEAERRAMRREVGMPPDRPLYPPGWTLPFPEHLPVYDRMLSDDAGCLWLRRYPLPGEEISSWDVADPASQAVATFSFPRHNLIRDVRDGTVVVLTEDELGVQRIELFGIDTGKAASRLSCDFE